jgi:hypothetical protein
VISIGERTAMSRYTSTWCMKIIRPMAYARMDGMVECTVGTRRKRFDCGCGESGRAACVAEVTKRPLLPVKVEVNAVRAWAWRTKKMLAGSPR